LVEAYHDKESKNTLYIYDSLNGNIIDTLDTIDSKNAYYKIALLKSEYGWFKLKNSQRLPYDRKSFDFENYWVKSKDFIIYVVNYDNNHQIYLCNSPSKKANRIHKLNNFKITSIPETSAFWTKVSFKVGTKTVEG
jgi:hypothetical protein